MRKTLVILKLVFCLNVLYFYSQPFSIGHKQITFVDPSRSNRNILTEIYYPASTSGDNAPIVNAQFPVLVFGHGFVMSWDAYQNFWDSLVPHGYIMVFPRTEGSISPNHQEFGLDLRFLNEQMKNENNNPSSFFYQKINLKSAIMGHSMGGGASFLAASNYTNFTTLINFAAANTNPSAIDSAKHVTVPLLMFIGQNDGVTPPNNHQIPMYDSCVSVCKTRVTILGGGHCYFANSNFNCSFGEGTTSPQPTISRTEQHRRMFYILKPYLGYVLKNNVSDSILFFNRLQNTSEMTYVRQCNVVTQLTEYQENKVKTNIAPNPASQQIKITFRSKIDSDSYVSILDITGRVVMRKKIENVKEIYLDVYSLNNGVYFVQCGEEYEKFIKE